MRVDTQSITLLWHIVVVLLWAVILLRAALTARWRRLRDAQDLQILIVIMTGVYVMWSIKAGLGNTLELHLLGATLMTLMFGWAYAVLGMSLLLMIMTFIEGYTLLLLPLNALLLVVLPVTISHQVLSLSQRYLPHNFFVYVFIGAFFGAALSIAFVILVTSVIHLLAGTYTFEFLQHNYFQYALLLMFPEAFVTGMLMTLFVVFRPEWVSTFDDSTYLNKP